MISLRAEDFYGLSGSGKLREWWGIMGWIRGCRS